MTGAVEMMIVDYQCIMPAISQVAACYHTKMISTCDKAKFPGMEHHEFPPENALRKANELVKVAIENFPQPRSEQGLHSGGAPGGHRPASPWKPCWERWAGPPQPLIEAIKAGKIRGAVGVVGCNNPKIKQDFGHVTLTRGSSTTTSWWWTPGACPWPIAKAGLQDPWPPWIGRPGAEGSLRGAGHPAGPARGQLCRQCAHPGAGRGPGQRSGLRHQRPAGGRFGPRVVFGKSRDHRRATSWHPGSSPISVRCRPSPAA